MDKLYELVTDVYGNPDTDPDMLESWQRDIEGTCRVLGWPMPDWYERADGAIVDRTRNSIVVFRPIE